MKITRREAVKIAVASTTAVGALGACRAHQVALARTIPTPQETRNQVRGHEEGAVNAVAFRPDGMMLASAGDDGTVRLWDVATAKESRVLRVHTVPPGAERPLTRMSGKRVLAVAFSADGKTLASGADCSSVQLWDLTTGSVRSSMAVPRDSMGSVSCISFTPDGKKLAGAIARWSIRTYPCRLIVWDLATGRELCTIQGHRTDRPSLVFVPPDGKTLALSGGKITIHDATTGKQKAALLTTHGIVATALAVSADGSILASVEQGCTEQPVRVPYYQVVLWDIATGKELAMFEPQTDEITSLAFSPDGKLLASGDRSWTGRVTVWQVATGNKHEIIQSEIGPVYSVAFSPSAKTLAVGYRSGAVRFCNLT